MAIKGLWYYCAKELEKNGINDYTGVELYRLYIFITKRLNIKQGLIGDDNGIEITKSEILAAISNSVDSIKENTISLDDYYTLGFKIKNDLIYETDHKKGKKSNNEIADDMTKADFTDFSNIYSDETNGDYIKTGDVIKAAIIVSGMGPMDFKQQQIEAIYQDARKLDFDDYSSMSLDELIERMKKRLKFFTIFDLD